MDKTEFPLPVNPLVQEAWDNNTLAGKYVLVRGKRTQVIAKLSTLKDHVQVHPRVGERVLYHISEVEALD